MGFTNDAMSRFQQNRELRNKKAPFQRMEENNFINTTRSEMKFKEATEEELTAMRKKLIQSNEKDSRSRLLIFIAIVLSLGFVFWLLVFQIKFF